MVHAASLIWMDVILTSALATLFNVDREKSAPEGSKDQRWLELAAASVI